MVNTSFAVVSAETARLDPDSTATTVTDDRQLLDVAMAIS